MPLPSVILIFVRQPAPGRVKSRIAAALGEDAALELYRALVLDTLAACDGTGIASRVFVHPPDAVPAVARWLGGRRTCLPQEGAELGERMENAFRGIFAEGAERAVLIGSDLPDLPGELLTEALHALARNDAVIGPARDGGYYLIGFRRGGFIPEIFRNMSWGRSDVFTRTMQVLEQADVPVHLLPPWRDVDTIEDLRDLMDRSSGAPFAQSRTMQHLGTIRDRLSRREERDGEA